MRTDLAKRQESRGFSLIELLVSITIGLILTLAITTVLIYGEKTKRSSTSVNDIDQTGTYAAYVLDRLIRSAGSGFVQNWGTAYGCLLNVSQGSNVVLPLPTMNTASAFTGISSGVTTGSTTLPALPIRLAPVVIANNYAGTGGDVLIVMAGSSGAAETGATITPGTIATGATSLPIHNALGIGTDDLVLLADSAVGSGCLMEQVVNRPDRTISATLLPLGSTYYTGSGSTVALTAFGASTTAIQLGNAGTTSSSTLNMPQFQMIGVGSNSTLFSYDLLQYNSSNAVLDAPIADGVVEMRAIYGVASASTGNTVDSWVAPTGEFLASTLTNGSAVSQKNLRRIMAIRLGLILRTSVAEAATDYAQPANTQLTLFADATDSSGNALKVTRTLASDQLSYRFRTVELTIPLRNALLAPDS